MNRPRLTLNTFLALALFTITSVNPVSAQSTIPDPESTDWDLQNETDRISGEVAEIRGLALLQPVQAQRQTQEALAAHIREGLRRQLGEDEGRYFVDALVQLGALKEPINLAETIISLASSQAAAHYDPESNTFYLLMTNMPLMLLTITASHELCHALQDQHFDLSNFMEGDLDAVRNNQDASSAKQFLVEGDATHVMTTWMVRSTAGTTNPATVASVTSAMLTLQAKLGYQAMCKLGSQQAKENGMDFLTTSLKDIDKLPRFFVEPLFESYFQGAVLVDAIKAKDGWAGVDKLYQNPPVSSEQVLHPDKLKEPRDNPADASLTKAYTQLGTNWVERERDVMGELGIRVLLKVWLNPRLLSDTAAASAAAGWGGDQYALLENKTTHATCVLWKTLWDTEEDANEFSLNWRLSLTERFPTLEAVQSTTISSNDIPSRQWEVSPGRYIQLSRKGLFVGIIDTTDPSVLTCATWH